MKLSYFHEIWKYHNRHNPEAGTVGIVVWNQQSISALNISDAHFKHDEAQILLWAQPVLLLQSDYIFTID